MPVNGKWRSWIADLEGSEAGLLIDMAISLALLAVFEKTGNAQNKDGIDP
jgi:hypothetical protein